MDAVSQILAARHDAADPLSGMLGASAVAHAVLFGLVLLVPAAWMGAQQAAPEAVMTVSLAGAEGPQTGGRAPESNRPVQEIAAPTTRPEPIRPPAAATPEMVEPTREEPKKTPPKPPPPKVVQPSPEKTARTTPTRGDEVRRGDAVSETSIRGQGFNTGLAAGAGGLGARIDSGNFCCPQYLAQIVARIRENWDSRQATSGRTGLRFVVQRDGSIAAADVELTSGSSPLDLLAVRAVRLVKQFPPLPPEYVNDSLTVHLTFEYQR